MTSKKRPPCSNCGRNHTSSKTEAACKAGAARTKHTSAKHTSAKHTSKSKTTKASTRHTSHPTTPPTDARTATATTRRDAEAGRHISTSLGPGLGDPVLLALLTFLGIAAIVLFVIGVWLLASRTGWPVGLNLSGNKHWTRFLSYGTACVIVALLFIPVIVFAVLAAKTRRGYSARQRRITVVFLGAVAFLILVLMTFNAIFFATNGPVFIANVIFDGWVNTVEDEDFFDACRIQNHYNCEGWEDDSCRDCQPTVGGIYENCTNFQRRICPRCFTDASRRVVRAVAVAPSERGGIPAVVREEAVRGCKTFVLRRYRGFFIPMSLLTIFLAVILFLLAWKTCIDSSGR